MDKAIDSAIRTFIVQLSEAEPRFHSAYLFGSFAKGNSHQDSDVDVAIMLDKLPDEERFGTQVRMMMTASRIDSRIEPHPISIEDFNSENPFAMEIKRTAKPIILKAA